MHEDLVRLNSELGTVLKGLDAPQCQLTPAAYPYKWNVQQIVEHLLMSYRSTEEVIQVRLEKRKPTQANPTLPQRLGQFFLITCGYFPPGRQAPPNVSPTRPASLRDGDDLTRRVDQALSELDAKCTSAHQLFGNSRFASHQILGSLSAAQWTRFHLVHGLHHIRQIRHIRRDHTC